MGQVNTNKTVFEFSRVDKRQALKRIETLSVSLVAMLQGVIAAISSLQPVRQVFRWLVWVGVVLKLT